jgi:predicted nucleic acid-binding protein
MIETIVIDTNIIIRLFSGDKSCHDIIHQKLLLVSFITQIELLSWPTITSEDESTLNSFLHDCFINNITEDIKRTTIEIRKKYKLKTPDAIIAATALNKKLSLFSTDEIFKKVKELNFIHVQ